MKKSRAWLEVGVCAASIFAIVPLARAIQTFADRNFGRAFFVYAAAAAVVAALGASIYVLAVRLKVRRVSQILWLVSSAALFLGIAWGKRVSPAEAAHILDYGLLSFLLFRAWRFSLADPSVYFASFFSGTLVGILDEIVQWVTPGRYWGIEDVALNALVVGLLQIALWKGFRPKLASPVTHRSRRIVSGLAASVLILLGLCLSATPERVSRLSARFPLLAPLEKQEPMAETILKHRDPDIGAFYSRMTVTWLRKIDHLSSASQGKILRDWKDQDYAEFLSRYSTVSFPFLHEMRVHLFRRDKRAAAGDDFTAWKENRILEKYFGETLAAGGYQWSKETEAGTRTRIDPQKAYQSPVSKNIFFWLGEGPKWISIGIILLGLLAYNILTTGRRRD